MKDETEKELQKLADETELDFSKVREVYDDTKDELLDNWVGDKPDGKVERTVLSAVRVDLKDMIGRRAGPVEELPALTLGARCRPSDHVPDWIAEGDAIIGAAIILPEEEPPGLATIALDTDDGVDLDHAFEVFEPYNPARLFVTRSTVGSYENDPTIRKMGKPTYTCQSSSETKLEVVDPDSVPESDPVSDLPNTRDGKRELINDHFLGPDDTFDIQSVPEHVAKTNANGYTACHGIDIKQFHGMVISSYVGDEDDPFSASFLTMIDDTIADEADVPDELITDDTRTPGLSISISAPLNRYGERSTLDVYGFIEERVERDESSGSYKPTGKYQFRAFGAVPDGPAFPRESYGGVEDDHEEEEI